MVRKYFKTINDIADELIREVQKIADPFDSPILVFHNAKIAQWFKAYYLKTHDEVLMNVRFMTLSSFVNGLINPDSKYTIIGRNELRDYIIKALIECINYDDSNPSNPTNYIFKSKESLNGINLFEFADKLSTLFMNYEYDLEDMGSWTDGKWEKEIYEKAIKFAESDNCYTSKSLFEAVKGTEEFQKKAADKVFIIDNSYITNLFIEILEKFGSQSIYVFSLDASEGENECEEIISAPSILREVQAVHTRICQLIGSTSDLRFNDILVYAPNIGDYASTINQVFKQDDKEFPAIPYRIVGAPQDQQNMYSSLHLLFEIANKRFFTRKDLYDFVKNPMIKYIWDISDQEITNWMNAIDSTNTYRNGKEFNDWKYLKNRLLLAQLVSDNSDIENATEIDGKFYIPYRAIDLDFDSINKLTDITEALLKWSGSFDKELNDIILSQTDIEAKSKLLDALYSKKGADGEEKNYLYRLVLEENEKIKGLNIKIPANAWMRMLLDTPKRFASYPADMFVGGVTFMSLNSDDIVSKPYIFVMGLASHLFPRVAIKSEIDYSKEHISSEKLDAMSMNNICNAAEHCVCSYVNRDLKKDSDYYPSSLMPGGKVTTIALDEDRDYSELFTQKEFSNKAHYDELVSKQNANAPQTNRVINATQNIDEIIKISDIKKYLENTFVYKYEHLLGKPEDIDGMVGKEYESIDANTLDQYNVIKDVIIKDATQDNISLTKSLPEKELGDFYFDEFNKKAQGVKEIINKDGYKLTPLPPLELIASGNKWTLICDVDMYTKKDEAVYCYLEPIDGMENLQKIPSYKFLNAYIFSLMDIIQNHKDEGEVKIELYIGPHCKEFSISVKEATTILNELYGYMIDYSDMRYMDWDLLKAIDEAKAKIPSNVKKLRKEIENHNKWKYFSDRTMIDEDFAFGYCGNIQDELIDFANKIKKCVRFEL